MEARTHGVGPEQVRVQSEVFYDPCLTVQDGIDDFRAFVQHSHLPDKRVVQTTPGKQMERLVRVLPDVHRTRIHLHYRQDGIEGVVRDLLEVESAVDRVGD